MSDTLEEYVRRLTAAERETESMRARLAAAGGGLAAHASTHETGGSDALNLGSIAGTLTDTQHGARGGGTLHAVATQSVAGFMSATDKTRLDGITANDWDARVKRGVRIAIYTSSFN